MTAPIEISLERLSGVITRRCAPVHRTFRIYSTPLRTVRTKSAEDHDETQPIPRMTFTLVV